MGWDILSLDLRNVDGQCHQVRYEGRTCRRPDDRDHRSLWIIHYFHFVIAGIACHPNHAQPDNSRVYGSAEDEGPRKEGLGSVACLVRVWRKEAHEEAVGSRVGQNWLRRQPLVARKLPQELGVRDGASHLGVVPADRAESS